MKKIVKKPYRFLSQSPGEINPAPVGWEFIVPHRLLKNTNKLVLKSPCVGLHLCIIKTDQENKQNLL